MQRRCRPGSVPLSYSLEAASRTQVHVHVEVPAAAAAAALRLRLPAGEPILSVTHRRPSTLRHGTIDLSGARAPLDFVVRTA